jgi:hypothetical protein
LTEGEKDRVVKDMKLSSITANNFSLSKVIVVHVRIDKIMVLEYPTLALGDGCNVE